MTSSHSDSQRTIQQKEKKSIGQKSSIHWAWIILATCFLNLFISYSVRLGYGVVLPEMIRDLGFGRTAGGSIYNAYLFTYIAFTPLTGYLTDRIGARPVITACALLLGLGVFLMGTITTLWTACMFYALAGLGASGMWTPVITVVQRWFSPHRRGLALGILSSGYGLGLATMGVMCPLVVRHLNWRYSWYFLGAGALVMVSINGLLLRNNPEHTGYLPWGQEHGPFPTGGLRTDTYRNRIPLSTVFRDKRFWLIGFSYFFISYSLYGITTFMVDYANNQIGLPLEKASLLATVHGFSQILGVLTILPLSDYTGRKKALVISNSCIAACLILILLAGSSWGLLCVTIGVMAFFYGPTWPMYGACAGEYFPKELMGTVIGAWTPFYGLGAVLAHWVTGILRDTTGSYNHAFAIGAAMAAAAVLFMCMVKGER